MTNDDSRPDADRERSYSGGYMKIGKAGEEIAFAAMLTHPYVEAVEDLRDDLDYRARGIDARLRLRSGRRVSVEIKTDNHLDVSGNWLFELFRIYLTMPVGQALIEGWSVRSEAEWLVFYAPQTRRLHYIKMEDYRRAHIEASAAGKCFYSLVPTDRIKRTLNAYFPEAFIKEKPSYYVYGVPEILKDAQ